HEFERIWFIPSYFASPHKAVLFDPVACIVVVDCRLGPYLLDQVRDELTAAYKAIADPTRLEILRLCGRDRQYGQSLATQLKLKPATIAHHLELLRGQGLLTVEAEGAVRYHRLDRNRLEELFARLRDYVTEEL
ncbi:MAG: ArsR/SmtB family transcription factor, partial [Bacillota bacterium]